jgi:hypothetical protein
MVGVFTNQYSYAAAFFKITSAIGDHRPGQNSYLLVKNINKGEKRSVPEAGDTAEKEVIMYFNPPAGGLSVCSRGFQPAD